MKLDWYNESAEIINKVLTDVQVKNAYIGKFRYSISSCSMQSMENIYM
jgi:hypothetical protein